jgi:hypothetical protein
MAPQNGSTETLGGGDVERVWAFQAPDDQSAAAAGQEIVDFALSDGWTLRESATEPDLAGSWYAEAVKDTPRARLILRILAVSAAYAAQKADEVGPSVQVRTEMESRCGTGTGSDGRIRCF